MMGNVTKNLERIAQAIRYLSENAHEQPSLERVAACVGLSRFHFQRLFKQLVGVSPKQFLQALNANHARRLLAESASVLDTALEIGLSGPSRLHDLMVSLEAMTPGEVKTGGGFLSIRVGFVATPFGRCLVARTERGICRLAFLESEADETDVLADLQHEWPNARLVRDDSVGDEVAKAVFSGDRFKPVVLHVRGSNFQIQVWRAILAIPSGRVSAYGRIARQVRQPNAARAVGEALANNPVAVLIPCHRVIRETGVVGEYRWGASRKRALLAWEIASDDESVDSTTGVP